MTGRPADDPGSPIEAYLDELLVASSHADPRQLRHLLAEAEAHLRDDSEAAIAAGMSPFEAEAQAVARFGSATELARADRSRQATPLPVIARQTLLTGLLLGGVGAVAVGVSGLLAEILRLIGGARFLVGVPSVLPASDCARWLKLTPGARSCASAAVADWANETVAYRIALGVLGVLALLTFRLLVRRRGRRTLAPAISDTIAVTLFAAAGVCTLGLGVDAVLVSSGRGAGQWLSAAPVALAGAAFYGTRLVRRLGQSAA